MLKRRLRVHVFPAGSRTILLMQWLMWERQSNKKNHTGSPWKTAHFPSSCVHWWAVFHVDDRQGYRKYHCLQQWPRTYLKKCFFEQAEYFRGDYLDCNCCKILSCNCPNERLLMSSTWSRGFKLGKRCWIMSSTVEKVAWGMGSVLIIAFTSQSISGECKI